MLHSEQPDGRYLAPVEYSEEFRPYARFKLAIHFNSISLHLVTSR